MSKYLHWLACHYWRQEQISQAFAALDTNRGILSLTTTSCNIIWLTSIYDIAVGVMGDSRVYGYICILRAVNSLDFMSCEPFEFPFPLLQAISRRIVNEVDGISRVVVDITSKPPGKTQLLTHLSTPLTCHRYYWTWISDSYVEDRLSIRSSPS